MRMKPFLIVAACAFVLQGSRSPGAQAPAATQATPRPADAMVPGPAETVSLDLPTNPFAAYTALTRLLDAAGVRYGIESPAWNPAALPIDLARPRDAVLMLGGRRLGDALDLIVKAVPEFRWTDRDGVIAVRSTADGAGILDRRIAQFTLTDASPRRALEAVIAAIDPARPPSAGIVGFGRPGSGAGFKPERTGRNVTMSVKGATVQSILTGIARENGALSWTIKYDRAPASPDSVSITFIELGVEVTALSPYAQQTQGMPGPLTPNRVTISSLSTMLLNYGERSGLRINFEEAALRPGEQSFNPAQTAGMPQLELPDQPSAAIARIVALDSRYEWSEKGGSFLVRPKPGVPGRLAVLDAPVNGFRATNEPANAVIERAGGLLGTVRSSPAIAAAQGAGMPPSPITEAMARPIDVDVASPATVRDVFNAIADATGWSWTMRPSFSPGRPTVLSLQWRSRAPFGAARGGTGGIPVSAGGGWSTSVSIMTNTDLSPPPTPLRTPAVTVPAALDRAMPQTTLDMATTIGAIRQIGTRVLVPMGIEDVPRVRRDDPRYMSRPQPPLIVGPGPFSDALYVLLERLSGFELLPAEGIVNVAPSDLARSAGYLMNRPIDTFAVKGVGVFRAVGELRRLLDPQFVPADWSGAGQGTLNTPITLSLTRTTPRAILNEIARQHGRLTWISAFDGADASVANWMVTLVPLDNAGPAISLTALGGAIAIAALSANAFPAGSPLAIAPGARPVMLDLPVTSMSVRAMLQMAARATGTSIGFAGVTSTSTTLRQGEYYNLTGLSMPEILEKLKMLSPDYVTSVDNGVFHVRVREAPRELTEWLDRRIEKFDQKFENLRDAMQAVATIGAYTGRAMGPGGGGAGARGALPPGMPPGAPPGSGVVGGVGAPGGLTTTTSPGLLAMNAQMQKTIVLSMTNTTVREILDEIARQFGSLMWVVEQRTNAGGAGLSLLFSSENWTTATSVR